MPAARRSFTLPLQRVIMTCDLVLNPGSASLGAPRRVPPEPSDLHKPESTVSTRLRSSLCCLSIGLSVYVSGDASAEEYMNDGFTDGGIAGFQAGFVTGEMAAACFREPDDRYPVRLTAVRFLFGDDVGDGSTRYIGVKIFGAGGNGAAPSNLLQDIEDVEAISSNTGFNELDVSGLGVSVSGPWCVAIAFQHSGTPSVARDADGSISAGDNWIYGSDLLGGFAWARAADYGVSGDWIIRTIGTPTGGGGTPDVGPADTGVPDAGPEDTGPDLPPDAGREDTRPPPDAGGQDAAPSRVAIVSINPRSAVAGETVSMQLAGSGFEGSFQYRIGPALLSNVQVPDPAVVTGTLDTSQLDPGTYDVLVNGGGELLADCRSCFQVRVAEEEPAPDSGCTAAGAAPGALALWMLAPLLGRRRRGQRS